MKRVKIVKRDERSRRRAVGQAEVSSESKGAKTNPEREAAAAVTRWVSELRHKRRAESERAFADLFTPPPRLLAGSSSGLAQTP